MNKNKNKKDHVTTKEEVKEIRVNCSPKKVPDFDLITRKILKDLLRKGID